MWEPPVGLRLCTVGAPFAIQYIYKKYNVVLLQCASTIDNAITLALVIKSQSEIQWNK